MLQQSLGGNYLIYHYWGYIYIYFIFLFFFLSLFFFFCEVKSKLLLALKKKANLLKGDKGTVAIRTETKQRTTLT